MKKCAHCHNRIAKTIALNDASDAFCSPRCQHHEERIDRLEEALREHMSACVNGGSKTCYVCEISQEALDYWKIDR